VGKIKLHHVFHTGANTKYYTKILDSMDRDKVVVTKQGIDYFVKEGLPTDIDILTYQTFSEQTNAKFNPSLVKKSDELFNDFKRLKILVCTNDCGDIDSFARLTDTKTLPRIKCFPSKWFLDKNNIFNPGRWNT